MNLRFPALAVLLMFAWFPICRADVFSLWPLDGDAAVSGNGQGGESGEKSDRSGNRPEKAGLPQKFWNEEVRVNGMNLCLEIFLIEGKLKNLAESLRTTLPKNALVMGNSNSYFVQIPREDGTQERICYISLTAVRPMLKFRIVLPKDRKKADESVWPANFPLSPGAYDLTIMEFPVRQSQFGSFRLKGATVPQVLGEVSSGLKSLGWSPVSREADNVFEGAGEVFMKNNPSSILILGIQQTVGGNDVCVSMYTRPL